MLTVGIRPCSGAILVLVFALAQGLFWAGVAATFVMGLGTAITVATIATIAVTAKGLARRMAAGRDGGGALLMRGLEFGAAGLLLLLGVGLLLVNPAYSLEYFISDANQTFTLTGITIGVGLFGGYAAIIAVFLGIAGFSPRRPAAVEESA